MRRAASLLAFVVAVSWIAPASASAAFADVDVDATLVTTLNQPIAMAVRPSDTKLYFAEKGGRIIALDSATKTTILNIGSRISRGGEQGLLGMTFSPSGNALYVNFTDTAGDTVVFRYAFVRGDVVTPGKRVLKIGQPFENHNGGNLVFGPDGFLYIAMGDGGSQDDPGNRAQRLGSLLGKMLRIRPLAEGGYAVPRTNPYVGKRGRDEIWARGFRNPWRYSFDDKGAGSNDALWIGDVGGGVREEIDREAASSRGGENYGWRRMEGTVQHLGTPPPGHHPPLYEYSHAGGNCSVTGGYVYRGSAIPDLKGAYVFGDFCVGIVRAFLPGNAEGTVRNIGATVDQLSSFGRDNAGELYAMSLQDGGVYRLEPAP